ncbi:hypothetical protein BJV82DRAFT_598811 [Fennellomyces sp. T-0311]|nr:hypothetical protein BJV82DRAFT_598811 [Fennellomyces sp. T-0311]
MDIKNLLCPTPTFYACSEAPVNQCYQQTWSCASSDTESPDLSYSSPSLTPASSPPTTPKAIVPPLVDRHDNAQPTAPAQRPHRSGPQTRTPWTRHEDYLLQRGYSQGLSWAMISSTYLPHRSRGCCWGRFKTLQAKALERRDWDETEDQLLAFALKKHARLFKQAWKAVSHEMPNRSWRECESRSLKIATGNLVRKRQPQNVVS